jgi:hypothetical protein
MANSFSTDAVHCGRIAHYESAGGQNTTLCAEPTTEVPLERDEEPTDGRGASIRAPRLSLTLGEELGYDFRHRALLPNYRAPFRVAVPVIAACPADSHEFASILTPLGPAHVESHLLGRPFAGTARMSWHFRSERDRLLIVDHEAVKRRQAGDEGEVG